VPRLFPHQLPKLIEAGVWLIAWKSMFNVQVSIIKKQLNRFAKRLLFVF
jgi:hypothetical protein